MPSDLLIIDHPRLICGVLGELEARQIPVCIGSDDEMDSLAWLSLNIEGGFRNARVSFSEKLPDKIPVYRRVFRKGDFIYAQA